MGVGVYEEGEVCIGGRGEVCMGRGEVCMGGRWGYMGGVCVYV